MINRMKELRKRENKTQEEAAKIFSMQTTVYRRYETGERELKASIAICIANYYNVTVDYLIMNDKKEELKKEEIELLHNWRKLKEKQKTRILEEIEDYIEIERERKNNKL